MLLYRDLSDQLLDAAFAVHRVLGSGLLEQNYHNALFIELQAMGVAVRYNHPYSVSYRGQVVGEYFADLVVGGRIIVEIKSMRCFAPEHFAQLINYLSISGCRVGYLLNFQNSRLQFKRLVL